MDDVLEWPAPGAPCCEAQAEELETEIEISCLLRRNHNSQEHYWQEMRGNELFSATWIATSPVTIIGDLKSSKVSKKENMEVYIAFKSEPNYQAARVVFKGVATTLDGAIKLLEPDGAREYRQSGAFDNIWHSPDDFNTVQRVPLHD